jgi:hypothetical protein
MTLGQLIGNSMTDEFEAFDISEIQNILKYLGSETAIDIGHAEVLQQKTLYAADLITDYLAKLVKMVSFLESKISSVKNKTSLEYKSPDGKTTGEMRKFAGEASADVEELSMQLAKAKGAKMALEKKFDILIKMHHFYKDISSNQRKGIAVSNSSENNNSWK